jgi:hypothetical protein
MKKIVLLLTATSLALGAVTLHLVRELRSERAAGLELKMRIAELERAHARPPTPPASPFASLERAGPSLSATTPTETAPPPTSVGRAPLVASVMPANVDKDERVRMMRASMERQRALLRDPEYREAMRLQQKAMLPTMYPDLAAELELSAEQTDALMSLLADQQVRAMEHERPFFEGQPDAATLQELARNQQEQQAAMDNEVRDLLGENTWREWSEYKATMGVRHEVSQMRTTLALNGAPLEDSQVKPLQRALLEAQQRQIQEWNRNATSASVVLDRSARTANQHLAWQEQALGRQREHNAQLRDALKSVLTDAQLRHIEQQHSAQLKLQEAHLRMERAQAEAEGSGQIAPDAPFVGEAVMITNGALFADPAQ